MDNAPEPYANEASNYVPDNAQYAHALCARMVGICVELDDYLQLQHTSRNLSIWNWRTASNDFSSAQLLDENDPTFTTISTIAEQKIRGKILCLQYQGEGPRDVAVSDVSENCRDFEEGVWYDISLKD